MPCSAREMRRTLTDKLGCEESEGTRHTKYKLYHEGQLIAMTVTSHGASELHDSLVSQMARELCVRTTVLRQLYECTYNLPEYLQNYDPNLNLHALLR